MSNRLARTPLLLLAALLAALSLGACGGAHDPVAHGEGEGSYVKVGQLVYQVQLSRELNPQSVEDRNYLQGLAAGTAQPAGDEEWFGVWLRVQNTTGSSQQLAGRFKIVDSTGGAYEPIPLPATNLSAYPLASADSSSYQPVSVDGKDGQAVYPSPDSIAGTGPIQGSMLLFKLKTSVYSNRPLELEITPPEGGSSSTVTLDL
jgi:hypothetical protein